MAFPKQVSAILCFCMCLVFTANGFSLQTAQVHRSRLSNRISLVEGKVSSSKAFQLRMAAAGEGQEEKALSDAAKGPQEKAISEAASEVVESTPAPTPQREPDTFEKMGLPWWLNPNTKGGVLVVGTLSLIIPYSFYYVLQAFGVSSIVAGQYIGVGFVFASCVLWTFSYIFRVATKDMTYAKQLKDYENAVLEKRLEELKEDEVQALMEEIKREDILN